MGILQQRIAKPLTIGILLYICPLTIHSKKNFETSIEEACYIIKDWLNRYVPVRRLDFHSIYYVKYKLTATTRKGLFPISFDN
jgi:hypothetical protein